MDENFIKPTALVSPWRAQLSSRFHRHVGARRLGNQGEKSTCQKKPSSNEPGNFFADTPPRYIFPPLSRALLVKEDRVFILSPLSDRDLRTISSHMYTSTSFQEICSQALQRLPTENLA